MPNPADAFTPVSNWLKREYPRPVINPTWIRSTIDQVQSANSTSHTVQQLIHAVRDIYLATDLCESTLADPPCLPVSCDVQLDPDVGDPTYDGVYFDGGPAQACIVQVVRVQEIGVSAFSLQTTAEARREALSGATRIRGIRYAPTGEDGGQQDDEQEEEVDVDGVPPYQRSMLLLDVSDGRRTMRAMELRRIEALQLGVTELGSKLLLKNIRVRRGILQLTPDSCIVKGGCVDWMEERQGLDFKNGLRVRMGKPALQDHSEHAGEQNNLDQHMAATAVAPPQASARATAGPSSRRPVNASTRGPAARPLDATSDYSDDFPIDIDDMQMEADLMAGGVASNANAEAGSSRRRGAQCAAANDDDFSIDEPDADEIQAMLEAEAQARGGHARMPSGRPAAGNDSVRKRQTSSSGLVDVEAQHRRKEEGRELARQYRLDEDPDEAGAQSSPPNAANTSRFFAGASRYTTHPVDVDFPPANARTEDASPAEPLARRLQAAMEDVDMLFPDDESDKENKPPPPRPGRKRRPAASPEGDEREVIEISD